MAKVICGCGDTSGQPNFKIGKQEYMNDGEVCANIQFECGSCGRIVADGAAWFEAVEDEDGIGVVMVGVNAEAFPHHTEYRKTREW
jgi:hypothetical protein